jgi:hypothetical protein
MKAWLRDNIDVILNRLVGVCCVLFLIGVVIPLIFLSLDRDPPFIITNPKIEMGPKGKVVSISANVEMPKNRNCGFVMNPIYVGNDGNLEAANQTRYYSSRVMEIQQKNSPGVFKTHLMLPKWIDSDKSTLSVALHVSCDDNFVQQLFPIRQIVDFNVETENDSNRKRE